MKKVIHKIFKNRIKQRIEVIFIRKISAVDRKKKKANLPTLNKSSYKKRKRKEGIFKRKKLTVNNKNKINMSTLLGMD